MAHVQKSKLSLRISGESLIPTEITHLLGASPTFSHAKGDSIRVNDGTSARIARFGMWLLSVNDRSPENLEGQLRELFEQLTDNLNVWRQIQKDYSADLLCGLFMQSSNEGFSISTGAMRMIADRGLTIGFDLYGGAELSRTSEHR
jgi:hypothetical protein